MAFEDLERLVELEILKGRCKSESTLIYWQKFFALPRLPRIPTDSKQQE